MSAASEATPAARTSGVVPAANAASSRITRRPGSAPALRRPATTPPRRLPRPQRPSTKPVALGDPAAAQRAGTATSTTPTPAPTTNIVASRVRTPGDASAPASPPTRSGAGRQPRDARVSANATVPSQPNTPQASAAAGVGSE